MGYFEGSHHKKKWLVSSADLEAMYAHFKGKKQIPLWCDGRENATTSGDDEQPCKKKRKTNMNESMHMKKVSDREEELGSVSEVERKAWKQVVRSPIQAMGKSYGVRSA